MRLLVISQWFPFPPINGARQRVYHLLKGLSERHELHLLAFAENPTDMEQVHALAGICRKVSVVPGSSYHPTVINGLRALFSSKPRSSIACYSSVMARLIREQIRQHKYDAAIAFTTRMGEYLMDCPIPKILDNDNVDAAYFERLVNVADRLSTRFRRRITWVKAVRHERRLLTSFDATIAVSEDDRREIAGLLPSDESRGTIHVVPNGVDLELVGFSAPEIDPVRLIWTGALTYHANLDAAAFFCERILPGIKDEIPQVRLFITGGYKGVNVPSVIAERAVLTGFVEDIRPLVAGSAALVVPLRIGGGTRLKILEAMALGTPVVSTTLGAAGIDVRDGETVLVADDPAQFAEQVIRLLKEPGLRQKIAANARLHVIRNFGWDRSVRALNTVLEKVTG